MKNFGRRGVEWDSKVEDTLGLGNIVRAIDWLAETLGTDSFARDGKSVVVKIRTGKENSRTGVLANYHHSHKIHIMEKGGTRTLMLGLLVHELVHAFQYRFTVNGKVVAFTDKAFSSAALKARYAGQVRGKAYLSQPIEIQAFAVQYKYCAEVLEIQPTAFSGNRVICYLKLGIDILNIL